MPTPSSETIRGALEGHVELWNAGDKEAWLQNWRTAAPGELTSFEDPVGTPPKRGWETLSTAWDESPAADWTLRLQKLIVCGNQAAAFIRNDGKVKGKPVIVESIEIYSFGEDGSLAVKTYWDIPEGSEYATWVSETR
jgi:hypothetical protein